MAAQASARLLTSGTITPIAPASSTFMISLGSLPDTRTNGVVDVVEIAGSMWRRSP
jgi:hypothetical protein